MPFAADPTLQTHPHRIAGHHQLPVVVSTALPRLLSSTRRTHTDEEITEGRIKENDDQREREN